jgi:hypothetical protein
MLILKQKTKNVMETEKNFHEYEKKFFGGSIILCLTPYLVCFSMAGSFLTEFHNVGRKHNIIET